ncbi:MAG: hypothetical protein SGI77_21365 [Pirellulaceae bacterium]|nr:hypothetical protein [Pirellulaceae bacterium]
MAAVKPVHEVRLGKVKAAIWRNETDAGTRFGITFSRIYKTDTGWESSASFGRDELPLLAKVADIAHTWIYQQNEKNDAHQEDSEKSTPSQSNGRRQKSASR